MVNPIDLAGNTEEEKEEHGFYIAALFFNFYNRDW